MHVHVVIYMHKQLSKNAQLNCGFVQMVLLMKVYLRFTNNTTACHSITLHSDIQFVQSLHQFSFPTPAIPWVSVTIVTRLLNLANGLI